MVACGECPGVFVEEVEEFGCFEDSRGSTSSPLAEWALNDDPVLCEALERVAGSYGGYVELVGNKGGVEDRVVDEGGND